VRHGDVTAQRGQRRLVEDLGDEAHLLVHDNPAPVADSNAGGLLTAVLQRLQAVVGELRDVLAWRPDAEDSATVSLGSIKGIKIMRETAVWLNH
jgi:hypothetical protein